MLDQKDKTKLAECHEDIQLVLNRAALLYGFHIVYGHRGPALQFDLYKQGRKLVAGVWTIEPGGKVVTYCDGYQKLSNHNYKPARAVDVIPDSMNWKDLAAFSFLAGKIIAIADDMYSKGEIKHKLRWGGDWDQDGRTDDEKLVDYPHIEVIL
jgi:peptidoglycan LD-endopeptidase CwlK